MNPNIMPEGARNPVRPFFELLLEIFLAMPTIIQALIGMVLLAVVFLGLMLMIRS